MRHNMHMLQVDMQQHAAATAPASSSAIEQQMIEAVAFAWLCSLTANCLFFQVLQCAYHFAVFCLLAGKPRALVSKVRCTAGMVGAHIYILILYEPCKMSIHQQYRLSGQHSACRAIGLLPQALAGRQRNR
jgi:hypothetical protein